MLNEISFKNYKAYKTGKLNLKPITILLGANNAGKSSIIKLLLTLSQTASVKNSYNSALKLHGRYVSLGNSINVFHKKNKDNLLELEFKAKNNDVVNSIKKYMKILKRM